MATALRRAGAGEVVVANRTPERGRRLADEVGGAGRRPRRAGRRSSTTATSSSACAAGEAHVTAELVAGRPAAAGPLLIVDIAVPRNVERAVAELAGVTLLDLDDLRVGPTAGWRRAPPTPTGCARSSTRSSSGSSPRRRPGRPRRWSPSCTSGPRQIRAAEVARFAGRLGGLDDAERDAVEALTRSIVAKLLHEPSVRLRHDAGTPQGERNAAAVSDLFELEP